MNNENYDQVQVPKEIVGSSAPYLQENMTVKLSLHDMNPVAITLPQRATLEVVETEPVTKGQTALPPTNLLSFPTGCAPRCRRISEPERGSW